MVLSSPNVYVGVVNNTHPTKRSCTTPSFALRANKQMQITECRPLNGAATHYTQSTHYYTLYLMTSQWGASTPYQMAYTHNIVESNCLLMRQKSMAYHNWSLDFKYQSQIAKHRLICE